MLPTVQKDSSPMHVLAPGCDTAAFQVDLLAAVMALIPAWLMTRGLDPSHPGWAPSCAYGSNERQGAGGDIDAVYRNAVRDGIGHIGELARRLDRDRAREQSRSDCSYGQ